MDSSASSALSSSTSTTSSSSSPSKPFRPPLLRKHSSNGGMGNLVVGMLGLSVGSSATTRKILEESNDLDKLPDATAVPLSDNENETTKTNEPTVNNANPQDDKHSSSDEDDVTTLISNHDDLGPLIQALERSRRRKKVLSHDVKRYVNHITEIKKELGEMQEKLVGSEASVRMLHRKANALELEVTALKDREEAAMSAMAKLHSQSGNLHDEHSSATRTLAEEIQYLRNRIINGDEQVTKLTSENDDLRKQMVTLQSEYKEGIENLRTDHNAAMAKVQTEHQETLEKLQAEHTEAITKAQNEYRVTIETLQTEYNTTRDKLQTENQTLTQTNVDLHETIAQLQQRIDNFVAQLTETRSQLTTVEQQTREEKERLQDQIQSLDTEIATAQQMYAAEKVTLQTELQELTENYNQERKRAEDDRQSLERTYKQLQEKFTDTVQTMTTEKDKLRTDIQNLQRRYDTTVSTYTKEKEELHAAIQQAATDHAKEVNQLKDTHKAILQDVRSDFQKQHEKQAVLLQNAIEESKSQLSLANTRQKDYEGQWHRAEERADELTNRLTIVSNENEQYSGEIERLTEELNLSKQREKELTVTLTKEKDRAINSTAQTVNSTWTARLEAQKEETQTYRNQCTSLQTELYDTNNQLVQEKNARHTAEFTVNNLRTRLTFEQEKVKELEQLLQQLREENSTVRKMEQDTRSTYDTSQAVLQQELRTVNEKLHEVQTEYQTYKNHVLILRQQCATLTAEVKDEKTQRSSLTIEVQQLTHELQQQKNRIPFLLQESNQYRNERDTLLTDLQRSREENTLLREQLAQLSTEASKAKVEALNGPAIAAHTISSLRKALHEMSEQCESAQQAMENLRAQNDELQTALDYSQQSTHEAMLIAFRNDGGLLEETLEGQLDEIDPELAESLLGRRTSFPLQHSLNSVHSLRSSTVPGTPRLTPAKSLRSVSPATIMVSSSTKAARLQALLSEQNRTIIQITKEKEALGHKLAIAETELNVYRQVDIYSATLRSTVEASLAAREELEG